MDGEGHYDALLPTDANDIHHLRRRLQNPWAYLDGSGAFTEAADEPSDIDACVPVIAINRIVGPGKRARRYTKSEIAALVRKLQMELWSHRTEIFGSAKEDHPDDVLDPMMALKAIGFRVSVSEMLGQYSDDGDQFEVAGIIDGPNRKAYLSRNFSPQVRRFTAAHELGHAILHGGVGLHRDRAVDAPQSRDPDQSQRVKLTRSQRSSCCRRSVSSWHSKASFWSARSASTSRRHLL